MKPGGILKAAMVMMAGLLLAGLVTCRPMPKPYCCTCLGHRHEVDEWRRDRVAKLRGENGWLSLVGLYWLKEGDNRMGAGTGNDIVFPDHGPEYLGTLILGEKEVKLKMAENVSASIGDKLIAEAALRSDASREVEPDRVVVGPFTFLVIERGGRLALRLFDRKAKALMEFGGIEHFPVTMDWRIHARFEPYDSPRKVSMATVIQTTEQVEVPGEVVFEVGGKEHRLTPIQAEGDKGLFFVFADKTNGEETYGGGRFLYTDLPRNGQVIIDFNKAYNPPCAFTSFATCPIPRKENRLGIRVEAGEWVYKSRSETHARSP